MRRTRKNYSQSDLDRALAGDKNLRYADLWSADLTRANLFGAVLIGAWLRGAVLRGAVLRGAVLTGANLYGANLFGANLRGAHLTDANLSGAYLKDVKYDNSTVWPDSVRDVLRVWRGDKNLSSAWLRVADLSGANLTGATLTGADLTGARLTNAKLSAADLTDAKLNGANLTGAVLTGAILDDIEYNEFTRWPEGFTPPQPERHLKRAYGSMTGPVLKFGKPEVPYRARDFKQKYPQEFDLLKRMTGGADFSPKFAENLRQTNLTPYDWIVTHGKYKEKNRHRLCPEPNFLLTLNIDMDDERFTAQQKDALRKLAETSRRSYHPYERDPLFTVGWVRICRDDANGVWLVEEVQSDIHIVRGKMDSEQHGSLSKADLVEVMEVMQPYIDRFYEDALGITLIEAEKLGYEVEMLDHVTKMRQGFTGTDEHGRTVSAAKPLYRDLPASMGISAKRRSKVLPDLQEDVRWTRPNPRLRR